MIRPLHLLAPGLMAALLCGCATGGHDDHARAEPAITPTEQFAIEVRPHADEVRLAAHVEGLSQAQQDALADLSQRWRDAGGGTVTIQAPTGGDPRAVQETSVSARSLLITLGVPGDAVRTVAYDPGPDHASPVIVGFASYKAVGPECGREWDSFTHTGQNKPYENFGCSIVANMAAQIANPHDLIEPRRSDPADAGRRASILDKYRKGEPTASAKDAQASGAVSGAVGSSGSN
jgi:pilus assembly protein CpaD